MEFIIAAILLLTSLIVFYVHLTNKHLPPGPYGLPLLGYVPFMGTNPIKKMTKLGEKYGNVCSLRLGTKLVVVLSDWNAVKETLPRQEFLGRPFMLLQSTLLGTKGILLSEGPIYKEQRRLMMNILREFGVGRTSIETIIMEEVDKLSEYFISQAGKPINISNIFFLELLNIIWTISAGKQFERDDENLASFREMLRMLATPGAYDLINFLPFLHRFIPMKITLPKYRNVSKKMHDFWEKEIDNHIRDFKDNNLKDFIDVYLSEIYKRRGNHGQDNPPYTKEHLRGSLADLFVASTDTTGTTLNWALLHMVLHPNIQRKVQEELDCLITKDSFLSLNLKKLAPYSEATLLEIQRHPTLLQLGAARKAMHNTVLMGYKIPKDTMILPNIYKVHHDNRYWDDPMTFNPERFLDETGQHVNKPEWFCPFAIGPRLCPGEQLAKAEMHLFFTSLLRRFTFETVPGEPKPSEEMIPGGMTTMPPFSFIVKPR